eukprot:363933-Chlamydomonas_euryale.AAC.10
MHDGAGCTRGLQDVFKTFLNSRHPRTLTPPHSLVCAHACSRSHNAPGSARLLGAHNSATRPRHRPLPRPLPLPPPPPRPPPPRPPPP